MVLVESKRERCFLDWLVEHIGHESVDAPCAELAGARRTYPSNVVVFGVVPPQGLAWAARADASAHLEEIAHPLGVRSCT